MNKIPAALALANWFTGEEMVQNALTSFVGISNLIDGKTLLYLILMISGSIPGIFNSNKKIKLFFIFILISILFPFISAYLFSIWIQPIFLARHLNVIAIALLIGLSYFIFLYRNLITIIMLSVYIFLSLSGFNDLTKIGIFKFNWRETSNLIYENIIEDSRADNIFLEAQNKEYNFQPLRYYLSQGKRIKNRSISGKLYFPNYIQDYEDILNYSRKDIKYNIWLFDFTYDNVHLLEFSERFDCLRKTSYSAPDAYFIKCEL